MGGLQGRLMIFLPLLQIIPPGFFPFAYVTLFPAFRTKPVNFVVFFNDFTLDISLAIPVEASNIGWVKIISSMHGCGINNQGMEIGKLNGFFWAGFRNIPFLIYKMGHVRNIHIGYLLYLSKHI